MKAIRLEVVTRPKAKPAKGRTTPSALGRLKTWLFGHVEGDLYTYQAAVRNVGDEPVDQNDLPALQFRWEFPTGQANIRGWSGLQDRIEPGQSEVLPEVDHHVLSSGFALLYIHTLRVAKGVSLSTRALEIEIQDSRGQSVPFDSTETMEVDFKNDTSRHEARSTVAFESFRALTGAEVKQYVLIVIAVIALLLNAVFGILNYLK